MAGQWATNFDYSENIQSKDIIIIYIFKKMHVLTLNVDQAEASKVSGSHILVQVLDFRRLLQVLVNL